MVVRPIDAIDASNPQIINALNAGPNNILYNGVRTYSPIINTFAVEATLGSDLLLWLSTITFGVNLTNDTTYTERLCHDGANGSIDLVLIGDCQASGQADLAEYYGSDGSLSAGDLVVSSGEAHQTENSEVGKVNKARVSRSSKGYQRTIIGVVSTNPNVEILSTGVFSKNENPEPIALIGRVPLKVSTENGSISPGDPLTSSSIPGVAMKATKSGPIVGKALASYSESGVGKIITFLSVGWYAKTLESGHSQLALEQESLTLSTLNTSLINLGDNQITLDEKGNIRVNGDINIAGDVTIDGKLFIGDSSSGKTTILKGKTKILVDSGSVSESSQVFVTPNTLTDKPLIVTNKRSGGFTVEIISPASKDISFDWFVIN